MRNEKNIIRYKGLKTTGNCIWSHCLTIRSNNVISRCAGIEGLNGACNLVVLTNKINLSSLNALVSRPYKIWRALMAVK